MGWRIGRNRDVAWIDNATEPGRSIVSAIPPIYARYATVVIPEGEPAKDDTDASLLNVLRAHTPAQPWWLGYLDTGAADIIFPEAPKVSLYADWPYLLVEAGPEQAARWRRAVDGTPWHGGLPELLFPADHSWLVSTLWDDDWRCVGGPITLITALLKHPRLDTHEVSLGDDATPPGHQAI